MLAFNVRVETNYTSFEGWRMSADYSSYNHTGNLYRSIYYFDPGSNGGNGGSETLCFGGRLNYDGEIYGDKLMNGIINKITFYENNMGLGMVQDQASYKCQPWCAICDVNEQPTCFEQHHESILLYWDFAPPHFYFPIDQTLNPVSVRPDISIKTGANMPLAHPMMDYGFDFIFADPIYVDRQGAFFDTDVKTIVSQAPTDFHVHSFSVEIWQRWDWDWEIAVHGNQGTVTGQSATQNVIEKTGGVVDFSIFYDNSNPGVNDKMTVNLGAFDLEIDIDSYGETITDRKWYFTAATYKKMNTFQSEICGYFGKLVYECEVVNTYFNDVHNGCANSNFAMGSIVTLGGGFIGVIRKVKVNAWAKLYMDMRFAWREDSDCLAFPGTQYYVEGFCEQCDIESPMVTHDRYDWNFKYECYSECEHTQYEWDCRECHAECRTCFGGSEYHCHSCREWSWDDFMEFQVRGTRCTDECGNGVKFEDIGQDVDVDGNIRFYNECDDGNLVNLDGCDNGCTPEPIYECINGNAQAIVTEAFDTTIVGSLATSACNEVCPDSRHIDGGEQCDDGNTDDFDGCSSTCTIENGFQCDGVTKTLYTLDYIYSEVCYETCGDGLNFGYFECDDGDTISGNGCSEACVEELGYSCNGGSTAGPDICIEICGDGYNAGQYQCDDGNTDDGDGCDSTCFIETGWDCDEVTAVSISFCWEISWPMLYDYWIENNEDLFIEFNETVVISSGFVYTDWEITIDGPIPPYDFTWEFNSLTDSQATAQNPLHLLMSFENQLYGLEDLTVTFTDQTTVVNSAYGIQTRNDSFVLQLSPAEDPSGEDCGTGFWKTIIFALIYLALFLAVINAFLLQSTLVVFHLIGNIQIIGMAAMYEAVYPTCLVEFFKAISVIGINLTFFGGQIFSSFVNVDSFAIPDNYKFVRMGVETSSTMINSGDVLFLWAILFLILFLVLAIEFVMNTIPYVVNLCMRYRYNFMVGAMNFTWLKLGFDIAVDFNYVSFSQLKFKMETGDQIVSGSITFLTAVRLYYFRHSCAFTLVIFVTKQVFTQQNFRQLRETKTQRTSDQNISWLSITRHTPLLSTTCSSRQSRNLCSLLQQSISSILIITSLYFQPCQRLLPQC